MIYLLDTNALSDLIREHPKVESRLQSLNANDSAVTCTIARGEILFGIERHPAGHRREDIRVKAQKILRQIPSEPVVEDVAAQYARIKHARRLQGQPMEDNDLWIAATAIALGAVLVTRDGDFKNIAGLVTENWTV